MSKLKRYLELNWPVSFYGIKGSIGDKAINVMRKLDEELGGKDKVIAELVENNKWQPIETAPKDGTVIWACGGDRQFECWFEKGIEFTQPVNDWTSGLETAGTYDAGFKREYPTHWRPLPDPPKDDAR